MIVRRAIVGLSLLCALVFCAFAASSASAEGTTAFTCVKAEQGEGFSDEHCDKAVGSGAAFKHEEISPNTQTEFELTNEKTASETKGAVSSVLIGDIGGTKAVQITCKKVVGTGILTNELSGAMKVSGSATFEHSECTVGNPSGCTVKEPIVYSTKFQTYQNKTEMGVEFTPKTGSEFGAISYLGKSCVLNGKTIGISGVFKGTPGGTSQGTGATLWFDDGETLQWGSNLYDLTGSVTWRMKGGGNPIALTTT